MLKTGNQTKFGTIAKTLSTIKEIKTPLQKKLDGFTKQIGVIGIVASSVVFILSFIQEKSLIESFIFAVSLAVAAVPEGLPAVMTITLAIGVERMAKRKGVVRKLVAAEALGSTTLILTDKTGTLTKGEMTVRRYLDILVGTFLVRVLAPWRENLAKRQVKAPKVFFSDTGLLHTLLQVETWEELQRHPRLGASWEGFALGQVVARLGARPDQCHFWSPHAGAELDLLVVHRGRRYGFEFKYAEAPPLTKSMRIAMQDLKLERLDVIHAGEHSFALGRGFRAVALRRLLEDLKPLT